MNTGHSSLSSNSSSIVSDELYEILSSLPESVVYSCRPCSVTQPSAWRELLYIELRSGVEKVLACLLSSTLTQHLVTCSQCEKLTDSDSGREGQPACDLRAVGKKFDKGLYTSLVRPFKPRHTPEFTNLPNSIKRQPKLSVFTVYESEL
ncbi:histone-lysine N-methyltransferase 2B-like [Cynoglossus semilaevis]|uniref:histone-lysine N-methyltransferase 2B-like n=1 Tax=Cynoglossus semilaevis TaxID=244447 RepID=UPI000D6284ED|nr:histone-lysine N-methyltransferase 2B-like [Cynoglossus semilaevis]